MTQRCYRNMSPRRRQVSPAPPVHHQGPALATGEHDIPHLRFYTGGTAQQDLPTRGRTGRLRLRACLNGLSQYRVHLAPPRAVYSPAGFQAAPVFAYHDRCKVAAMARIQMTVLSGARAALIPAGANAPRWARVEQHQQVYHR